MNIGRREAGEFIGIVVHRKAPGAIRGNVLWLSTGDEKFPGLRKKGTGTVCSSVPKVRKSTATLNGRQIADITDDPTDPAEARWKEAGADQPAVAPSRRVGGAAGYVKYRNIRVRSL